MKSALDCLNVTIFGGEIPIERFAAGPTFQFVSLHAEVTHHGIVHLQQQFHVGALTVGARTSRRSGLLRVVLLQLRNARLKLFDAPRQSAQLFPGRNFFEDFQNVRNRNDQIKKLPA